MDKDKILTGMSYVDPKLVEAADTASGRGGRARPALIAACLCLALAGTAVAAAVGMHWTFSGPWTVSGSEVTDALEVWSPEALPVESLTQEARDLAEAAGPEGTAYKGFSAEVYNDNGGLVGMCAWDEMERFLGVDILPENSVLRDATSGVTYIGDPESNPERGECILDLYNDANGELLTVGAQGSFGTTYNPAVTIYVNTNARTDRNPYSNGGGIVTFYWTEEELAQSTQEEYVTPSGLECLLTSTDQRWEAYFCYGASVVNLSASRVDGVDDEAVRAELIRVLDAFE